ncbi:hypothetical protein QR680_009802 [Steinernema hermaphroditum]|uniref:glucuronosyltransferase n=1 Tax=Steinernema hermaphroditum TaxID=289476 RepID=A0AA39ILP4_9BILA|nr:hypothetical protein QR680_009802 [Steinernema hermaphroditum]
MRALLFFFLLAVAAGTKVLIYSPRFGGSHVSFMGKVADILVQEGMDVTVLLPKMNRWLNANGTKLAKTITIETDPRVAKMYEDDRIVAAVWNTENSGMLSAMALLETVTVGHTLQCETNLRQRELLEFLRAEKFDLGVSEVFDLCGLGIFEEIGLSNHVIMQTALLPEKVARVFGVPNLPSLVPAYYSDSPMHMDYKDRALNLFKSLFGNWWTEHTLISIEEAAQKVLGRRVDFEKKMAEASFVFTNTDPVLDFPRAISERVINIGGLSVPDPKPLDAYWEEVVTERKTAVLISFGSVAQSYTMSTGMKKSLLETFRRFPEVTFIWKYEIDEDEVAKDVPNVVTNKWVPQNDLLAHPNLKLFVTHAGMNSILESTRRGVPMITIPLFGDQMRNAQTVRRFGNSEFLDKVDLLDTDLLEKTFRKLLQDESYRSNASRLSQMMAKRPRNQRDELVKHIKFAAEFGSLPEYRIPQLPFLQYYMLDIILPLIAFSVLVSISITLVVIRLLKCFFQQKPKKEKVL